MTNKPVLYKVSNLYWEPKSPMIRMFPGSGRMKAKQMLMEWKGTVFWTHCLYFHCITGFPPDILHDLLEGIDPLELWLCLETLLERSASQWIIWTLPYSASHLNFLTELIAQKLPENVVVSENIGGNGHENWTLLRLRPLLIGDVIPENDDAWTAILELIDIMELLKVPTFTDESLCYPWCQNK